MVDDVIMNKVQSVERCMQRVREDYQGDKAAFARDYKSQDAVVLNILRACETAIDLAMYVVRIKKLGVPQNSREAFELLASHGIISQTVCNNMLRMVGFRNIAVHNYRVLDMDIVINIAEERLNDFQEFSSSILTVKK
jgi:uncharacterized protein YutE (UPF0331/DUF86 family)